MEKISTVLDAEQDITDAPARSRWAGSTATSSSTTSCSRTARRRGDQGDLVRRAAGRLHRARRRVGRRQVDDGEADRALLRPALAARCGSTAPTCGTSSCARTGASSGSCSRTRSSSAGRSPRTSASRRPDATDDEVAGGGARDRRRPRRGAIPGGAASTSCAKAAPGSRPVSASSSRSRARCSPTRGSSILDEATSNIDRPDRGRDRARVRHAAARPHLGDHRAPARDGAPRRRDPGRRARHGSRSAGATTSCSRTDGPFRRLATTLHGAGDAVGRPARRDGRRTGRARPAERLSRGRERGAAHAGRSGEHPGVVADDRGRRAVRVEAVDLDLGPPTMKSTWAPETFTPAVEQRLGARARRRRRPRTAGPLP